MRHVSSPSVPASVSSWTRAAYEAADEARREARHQVTLRPAAEAMDRADREEEEEEKVPPRSHSCSSLRKRCFSQRS